MSSPPSSSLPCCYACLQPQRRGCGLESKWAEKNVGRARHVRVGLETLPASVTLWVYYFLVDAFIRASFPWTVCCAVLSYRQRQEHKNCFSLFLASHPEVTWANFLELLQLKNGEMGESLLKTVLQKWCFLWLMSPHSATWIMAQCCSTALVGNVSNAAVLKSQWRGREHKCLASQFVFGQARMEW